MVFEYIVISVENNMSQGPTFCGDASSDKELMAHCEATLHKDLGDPFQEYLSQLPPRIILNKLAEKGFRVRSPVLQSMKKKFVLSTRIVVWCYDVDHNVEMIILE
eukprot:m.184119 g.184119  ORF g.184119 m.184119 type:complete len:105 (-) comp14709_c0_seq8:403-717(-)